MSKAITFTNPPEEYYIKSNSIQVEGQGYLPSTYLDLGGYESKTFRFKMFKIADELELGDLLYDQGSIDVTVNPGMVLPKNISAEIDLHTYKNIDGLTASAPSETSISYLRNNGPDHKIYQVTFSKYGRNDITIHYDGDKKSVLQFWIIEDIEDALQRRVDFLMDNCRITDPSDPHYPGFFEWNNETGRL